MLPTTSSLKHGFPYNSQTNDLVSKVILSTVVTSYWVKENVMGLVFDLRKMLQQRLYSDCSKFNSYNVNREICKLTRANHSPNET